MLMFLVYILLLLAYSLRFYHAPPHLEDGDFKRVVIVPDVHGDYEALVQTLTTLTNVLDPESLRWNEKSHDTLLVIMGE